MNSDTTGKILAGVAALVGFGITWTLANRQPAPESGRMVRRKNPRKRNPDADWSATCYAQSSREVGSQEALRKAYRKGAIWSDITTHPDAEDTLEGDEFSAEWRLAYVKPSDIDSAPNQKGAELVLEQDRERTERVIAFMKDPGWILSRPPIVSVNTGLLDGYHRLAAWRILHSDAPIPVVLAETEVTE